MDAQLDCWLRIFPKNHDHVLGIDRSFSALKIAKKSSKNNLDFVLSDSLSGTFGQFKI